MFVLIWLNAEPVSQMVAHHSINIETTTFHKLVLVKTVAIELGFLRMGQIGPIVPLVLKR